MSPERQLVEIKRGVVDLLPEEELLKKLKEGKKLRVKFGADPSQPDLHLGHTVVLEKLRLLQDFGHEIYFIIGDFTARIGDPTGKSKTRPILSDEDVVKNAKSYTDQVGKILDISKVKIVYNNDWLSKLSPIAIIQLLSKVTVASILERDDFSKRMKSQDAIYVHGMLYPVMQGYDSVEIKADLELGGTDQTFNLLMGRHLQKAAGQEAQAILTMPILEGLDGVQKMSKSLDNYISLDDSATDMFGKLMSISDELMIRYYDLLSRLDSDKIKELTSQIADGSKHPMDAKKELAVSIVDTYYPKGTGAHERQKFEERFSKNKIPDDILEKNVSAGAIDLLDLLVEVGFAKSKGEGRRLLKQNAVKLDFKATTEDVLKIKSGQQIILKVGKLRMAKIIGN